MLRIAAACVALLIAAAHAAELRRSGFIGMQIAPGPQGGVAVRDLIEGGTATAAGLQIGDVLKRVNGVEIKGPAELVATIGKLRAGDRAEIEFVRGAETKTTAATIRPRPMEASPAVDTRYLAMEVNGNARRLIVTVPRTPGRHPAVLYMTGIGCFSQESLGLQTTEAKLLYGLTEAGFVTMRVEKSGIGDSEGPSCNAPEYDLRTELSGYVAGLATLRGYDFVDPANVFLLGLSIGGIEAPLVAQSAPVKGVVVVNTVAKPFLDYLQEIRPRQNVLRGVAYDEIEDRLARNARCNHALLVEKKDPPAVVAADSACADYIGYPAPTAYMREWTAVVPAKEWKQVPARVLVIHGEMDYISMDSDAPYLRDMINSFYPGHATLAIIPKMTHGMNHVESMQEALESGASAPFEPVVLDTIRSWMQKTAAG